MPIIVGLLGENTDFIQLSTKIRVYSRQILPQKSKKLEHFSNPAKNSNFSFSNSAERAGTAASGERPLVGELLPFHIAVSTVKAKQFAPRFARRRFGCSRKRIKATFPCCSVPSENKKFSPSFSKRSADVGEVSQGVWLRNRTV